MAFASNVLTASGTLIIAPPVGETAQQPAVNRRNQEDNPQQRQPQPEIILRRGNTESFADADKFREQKSFSSTNNSQNQSAVGAYQTLALESRRDEIKQIMGVDTYA